MPRQRQPLWPQLQAFFGRAVLSEEKTTVERYRELCGHRICALLHNATVTPTHTRQVDLGRGSEGVAAFMSDLARAAMDLLDTQSPIVAYWPGINLSHVLAPSTVCGEPGPKLLTAPISRLPVCGGSSHDDDDDDERCRLLERRNTHAYLLRQAFSGASRRASAAQHQKAVGWLGLPGHQFARAPGCVLNAVFSPSVHLGEHLERPHAAPPPATASAGTSGARTFRELWDAMGDLTTLTIALYLRTGRAEYARPDAPPLLHAHANHLHASKPL